MTFTLKVTTNTLTPGLREAAARVQRPRTLFEAGAKSVQRGIVTHLRALQSRGNKMGWPSQGFFARGPRSVEKNVGITSLTERGAVVSIADARFVHRITGGQVSAKRGQFLRIPLRAEAYALNDKGSVRESAPFLEVVRTKRGSLLLVRPLENATELWFALVRSVTHRPHPEEKPDEAALERTAGAAMLRAANILLKARGG